MPSRKPPVRKKTKPRHLPFGVNIERFMLGGLRRGWAWVRLVVSGMIWGLVGLGLVTLWFTWNLPNPSIAMTQSRRPAIRLLDPSGQLVARLGDVSGQVMLPATLPPYVSEAFIAIEDKRFQEHGPFDTEGILRALVSDLWHHHIVQGGSTLTQQVAKTLFLGNQRTFRRKVQEAILSVWLWRHYTRQEILGIYLNRVYLGGGAYGVDAAAKLYFNCSARQLTLAQAAVLAGLPKAPSSLNPLVNAQAAASRAQEVLHAMVASGYISAPQAAAAAAQLAEVSSPVSRTSWFALWIMQSEADAIPDGEDVTFTTTMDVRLQKLAQAALNDEITQQGAKYRVSQGAIVVLDARTGAVRALIGGVGDREGYDRAVLARRQTGSAIKPIVWLAGLLAGMSPDDDVLDAPLDLHGYRPHDDDAYRGEVSMTEALADSLNTVSVRILMRAGGPRRVAAVARSLGLADYFPDNATIALGTSAVGVMQLAGAYAALFNGGHRITPYGVTAINGANVSLPWPVQVVPEADADAVASMMRAVVTYGTGTKAYIPTIYTAGKTGTTQDYRDAWFVGYAKGDIIAVWLGNDNNMPGNALYGGTLPAEIFKTIAQGL